MCGRYTITVTLEELILRFNSSIPTTHYHQPRFNISPQQMIMIVINDGNSNRLGELKWGLLPSWSKDEKPGFTAFNARAETLLEKPAFKVPFVRKRCLIPADSFYEWKKEGKSKQPIRIMLKTNEIFTMAGLYDTWTGPDGRKISSCTIITTTPNSLVENIHDRMPVILHPKDEALWLDRNVQDTALLLPLLKPFPAEKMRAYAVSTKVGNAKYDVPECIEEMSIEN
jgi:putative SOS response-associated peptidase YedK